MTARLPRILILTHYYAPELGAPQTRLRETARHLHDLGHEVRVLTGPPHYPDGVVRPGYSSWRRRQDLLDGIPVQRLPMLPRPNGGLLDRTIDQATFAAAACAAMPAVRWSDVVLVESPPLFLGVAAAWHRLAARRPYVFHVADPWPDFPIAMGALPNPALRRVAHGMAALAYRGARLVTTVTPGLVALLDAKPSARGRVRLLPNGVETGRFAPGRSAAEARAELGWPEARLSLVYAGTVGLAQGVGTLVEAVAPLGSAGVVLHVVGEGREREALRADAARRGLDHVRFETPVPVERVPTVLAAADAIAVVLRRGPLHEHALPTKLVEGLAAGRPVVVSADGEAARLVVGAGAGRAAPAEDPDALRSVILSLAGEPVRAATQGLAARRLAESTFDRGAIVALLSGYLVAAAR